MKKLLQSLFILLFVATAAIAQNRTITGTVTSKQDGLPLPGVSVKVKGTNTGVATGSNGRFSISIGANATTLEISSLGFATQDITVGSSTVIDVSLETDSRDLNQVVVVGYGTQKKEAITGSVLAVSAKDIEKRPVTNVLAALEGMGTGLQISNSYGEPGSGPSIRIRGFNSINGNSSPLIVLDNVIYGGSINDINPNDVESISVLKDATSATLYGSRGSNGVILITTKRGKGATSTLNLTVNQGIYTRGIAEYDKVNTNEFMEVMWQGYRNQLLTNSTTLTPAQAGLNATANLVPTILKTNIYNLPDNALFDLNGKLLPNAQIKGTYAEDLDWFDPITRNGHRQDYNLSGQSGNEKSNLYYSVGYLGEEGYVTTSDLQRISGRVSGSTSPRKWIKTGFSINGGYQVGNYTTGSGSGYTTPWNYARNIAPIYPIYKHDLTTGDYVLDANGSRIYDNGEDSRLQYVGRHLIWENELNMDRTYQNSLNSQGFVELSFLKHFKFNTTASNLLRNTENRTYDNAIIGDGRGNQGRAARTIYRYNQSTVQQQLTFNKTFNNDHNVEVLVGHENYFHKYNYLYGYKTKQTFAGQVDMVNFSQITSLTDSQYDEAQESFLSRARYNYKEKYFVEGSFRRDGSSRLHPDSRWGNFWSIGGTWLASKEDFMASTKDYINDLKIRASTGRVGNIASVGLFGYMSLYTISQNNNIAALYKSQNGNPELVWEGQRATSAAIEGRFFDRMNLTLEYFDKGSDGLIFDVNQPLSAGATSTTSAVSTITKNIGKVRNNGFEISIDVDVLKKQDFKWNLGVNANILKSKIVELPEENRANGILNGSFKFMEGRSIYDYFLYQYAGVDMMTGQALYYADDAMFNPATTTGAHYPFLVNIDGVNYTRNAAYSKREYSGSAIPKVFGNFNTNFNYKNFSLSALFTYSIGGKGIDNSYMSLMSATSTPGALHKDILNSWNGVPEGMTATSPNRINRDATPQVNFVNSQYNNATSTRFLMDNSNFVIKNIAFGYTLPQNIVRKLDLSSVRLNILADNLATFTKLKGTSPEQGFNGISGNEFVPSRTFSFGINIGL
ncbi:MAG: SusC/RagA family TonB-linked outer membrane protein [Flavobacteriales bacterium]|nr:MAG: SusC/RagA family TonB-linked outer membrane protein [Flavobacteriales bacterium]